MNEPSTHLKILNYHAVIEDPLAVADWCFMNEGLFCDQMLFLKKNIDVLPFTEALERLKAGSLKRPAAVITFDDGFMNNFEIAFPILKRENIPATIFLTTGLVGRENTLWSCRLMEALGNTQIKHFKWLDHHFDLRNTNGKIHASEQLQRILKSRPHDELIVHLEQVIRILGQDVNKRIRRGSPFRMLDRNAIKTMLSSGLIELGAHTESHAILSLLRPDQKRAEIERSVMAITELSGNQCTLFAYPNGRSEDYDQESIQILKSLGVEHAVTTNEGLNYGTTPPLELKRFGIGSDIGIKEFESVIFKQFNDN